MIIDWAVTMTIEHEFDQSTERCKGIATCEMKIQRVVEGDDETCDALWAAEQAKEYMRRHFKIPKNCLLRVLQVDIKECE